MKRSATALLGILVLLLAWLFGLTWKEWRHAKLNHTLIVAIKHHDETTVVSALEEGADANTEDELAASKSFWTMLLAHFTTRKSEHAKAPTALSLVFNQKQTDDSKHSGFAPEPVLATRALLKHGANPNVNVEGRGSVLREAIYYDYAQCVRLLLEHGAAVNAADVHKTYPLMDAVSMQHSACEAALLEHGADPNVRVWNEGSLLNFIIIIMPARQDVLRPLLEHGADVNARDESGNTPLLNVIKVDSMRASIEHRKQLVEMLLAHHARVSITDRWGKTALDYTNTAEFNAYEQQIVQQIRSLLKRALLLEANAQRRSNITH